MADAAFAIPLMAQPVGHKDAGSTGFLARVNGELGLFTARHSLTMTDKAYSANGWDSWTETLCFGPRVTDRPCIDVFDIDEDGERSPRFYYFVETSGNITDMVGFFGEGFTVILDQLSKTYAIVDLDYDAYNSLSLNEELTCVGFPAVEPWPTLSTRSGPLVSGDNVMLHADVRTVPGMSGGPVFASSGGKFVGMVIGTSSTLSDVVSAQALRFLLEQGIAPDRA